LNCLIGFSIILSLKCAQLPPTVVIPVKNTVATTTTPKKDIQDYAYSQVIAIFGGGWESFNKIAEIESGWNPNALNKSSGACGIPQALPCSKIKDHSPQGQINWMIDYVKDRYNSPDEAWSFHIVKGWY
jgi:hypothetical protein